MKTVVITGSTRGIGYGLAKEFLKKVNNVVINGTTETGVNKAVDELIEISKNIIGVVANLSEEKSPEIIYNEAVTKFKTVDIWINNAGITNEYKNTFNQSYSEIKNVFDLNILGLINASNFIFLKFKQQGFGKIVNIEGLGSDGRIVNKLAIYGTSKRAVNYFNRAFSSEIKNTGVQILSVNPGMVITDLLKNSLLNGSQEEKVETVKIFNMLAEEVDTVCKFLVDKILKSKKIYEKINFMSFQKIIKRLLMNNIKPRNFFTELK